MNIEIKPCPFCGGKAEVWTTYDGWRQVACERCSARSWRAKTIEKAIENWNRRVDDDA